MRLAILCPLHCSFSLRNTLLCDFGVGKLGNWGDSHIHHPCKVASERIEAHTLRFWILVSARNRSVFCLETGFTKTVEDLKCSCSPSRPLPAVLSSNAILHSGFWILDFCDSHHPAQMSEVERRRRRRPGARWRGRKLTKLTQLTRLKQLTQLTLIECGFLIERRALSWAAETVLSAACARDGYEQSRTHGCCCSN